MHIYEYDVSYERKNIGFFNNQNYFTNIIIIIVFY